MFCHIVPHILLLWHVLKTFANKIYHLDEKYPSNRPNQNCDYLIIFCPSIPTAGQAITINQALLSTMVVVVVVVFLVVVVVVVVVVVLVLVVG